jgi:hypothetical protein
MPSIFTFDFFPPIFTGGLHPYQLISESWISFNYLLIFINQYKRHQTLQFERIYVLFSIIESIFIKKFNRFINNY